jgi:outer membrane protein OmpA-like peptidoglycan-associated protein
VELRLLDGAAPTDPVEAPARRRPAPAVGLLPLPGPIEFVPLKPELTEGALRTLAELAEALKARGERVEIGVHTDGGGDAAWKAALTAARATAVRDALVAFGVPATRLVARGYGATRPIASDATRQGRARNRRVELRLLDEPDDAPGPTAERRP